MKFLSTLIICSQVFINVSCQTKIISDPIKHESVVFVRQSMSDQVLSHKLHLILFNALPKIVEERYVLHKWDALDGTIKIYNQLDSTIIEEKEQYYIGDKIFKSLTNDRDKIPFKDKLDCLQPNFRYKFNYISDKSLCDIIISPEIQIEKEKFRFLKFQISGAETWIVKITYHQNWNDDCYNTQVVSKNIMMR